MANFTVEAILKASGGSEFAKAFKEAQDSVKGLEDVSKKIGDIGSSFQSAGKALTLGITAPVVAGITGVIKSYADLEQAVGGIETLFKGSADAVIKNSESAYTRAGVSGVNYMEQVTSFSATLLQGLGGDTEKAAQYADKAIVDMSDNANKFGTDISEIQRAYQGFAKDNYTMLDNLKLGYGGTAGEMARLVNESGVMGDSFEATAENVKDIPFDQLIEAIHVTQTEMGITGTTAIEASETVSGSFQSMKAAAENLVAGLGDSNADIGMLMANVAETVGIFVGNIKGVLSTIWDNLPLTDFQKWTGVIAVSTGPILIAIGTVLSIISKVSGAIAGIPAVLGLLSGPVGIVLASIAAMIAIGVLLYQNWDVIKEKAQAMFDTIFPNFEELRNKITVIWESIKESFSEGNMQHAGEMFGYMMSLILQKISDALPSLIEKGLEIVSNLISGITQKIPEWFEKGVEIMVALVTALSDFIPKLLTLGAEFVIELMNGIKERIPEWIESAKEMVVKMADTIKENLPTILEKGQEMLDKIVQGFKDKFPDIVSSGWEMIKTLAGEIIKNLPEILNAGKDIVNSVVDGIFSLLSMLGDAAFDMAKVVWEEIKNTDWISIGKDVISGIGSGISASAGALWDAAKGVLGNFKDNVLGFFGIKSPSRLMANEVGKYIPAGIGMGIEKNERPMLNAAKDMSESLMGAVNTPTVDIGGQVARSNGQINSAISHNMNMGDRKRPMQVNLNIGGRTFNAFVEDISNEQGRMTDLQLSF